MYYGLNEIVWLSRDYTLTDNKGVTLLALGNGAPDIFGAYAAITQAKEGDAGLAIGAIFGKANTLDTTANKHNIISY